MKQCRSSLQFWQFRAINVPKQKTKSKTLQTYILLENRANDSYLDGRNRSVVVEKYEFRIENVLELSFRIELEILE